MKKILKKVRLEDLDPLYEEVILQLPVEERTAYCKRLKEGLEYELSISSAMSKDQKKLLKAVLAELRKLKSEPKKGFDTN